MKVLKALFLLFLVLLFLMAAIPTNDAGADHNRIPAPTPTRGEASMLHIHSVNPGWLWMESKEDCFLKDSVSRWSEIGLMA